MKPLTYGVLPTREEFEGAFATLLAEPGFMPLAGQPPNTFAFTNDPRVGTAALDSNDLWTVLEMALQDWNEGDDEAGSWISSVLGVLGWEWI